jgi:hypothetical protein
VIVVVAAVIAILALGWVLLLRSLRDPYGP